MKNLQEANKKWWYRLLKVIFILFFGVSIITATTVPFFSYKPVINKYSSRYGIKCDNGVIRGDFGGNMLNDENTTFHVSDVFAKYTYNLDQLRELDKMSRLACKYDDYSGETYREFLTEGKYTIPDNTNYLIVVTKPIYYGSWVEALGYTIISIIGTITFYSLIRAVFFYIFFNSKFWRTLIWKKEGLID
jgi:hypothetical protein